MVLSTGLRFFLIHEKLGLLSSFLLDMAWYFYSPVMSLSMSTDRIPRTCLNSVFLYSLSKLFVKANLLILLHELVVNELSMVINLTHFYEMKNIKKNVKNKMTIKK